MEKYELISTALSCMMIALLPLHQLLIAEVGNQQWVNMLIGLPIGIATVVNIDIVFNKIRSGKD
jgi:hypothetical protein